MHAVPRVLIVIGTRPEGIKLAPVVEALRLRRDEVDARVVLTGQHTTLIDQVLDIFRLDVSRNVGIMKEGQDLYDVAHGCLDGLREVVRELRPDMLLVQGDTASVFFGALVGSISFAVPQIIGTLIGIAFGYSVLSSLLLGPNRVVRAIGCAAGRDRAAPPGRA